MKMMTTEALEKDVYEQQSMLRVSRYSLSTFGFIGLGQMGSRMAVNVLKDSSVTKLLVFDTSDAAVAEVQKEAAAAHGAERAKAVVRAPSVAALGAESDNVLSMLPNGKIVAAVYGEMLPKLKKGALLIDGSTIDPETSKSVGAKAVAAGARAFCDAPVSGGVGEATAGTLTFMVGAESETIFADVQRLLATMAKAVIHCGKPGLGQKVKLSTNIVLAQHMVAVAEAMSMGVKLGAEPKVIAAVMNISTGKCWSGEVNNPYPGVVETAPASRGYTGGFAAALMHKDLGLAIDAAKSVGASVKGADNAMEMYTEMLKTDADKDFSGIIRLIEAKSAKK